MIRMIAGNYATSCFYLKNKLHASTVFNMKDFSTPARICNPLPPDKMSARERHAELCALLAQGLIRLRIREKDRHAGENGDFSLHISKNRSGNADRHEEISA